jgi:hypothetical protein
MERLVRYGIFQFGGAEPPLFLTDVAPEVWFSWYWWQTGRGVIWFEWKVHISQVVMTLKIHDVMAVARVQKSAKHASVFGNDFSRIYILSREQDTGDSVQIGVVMVLEVPLYDIQRHEGTLRRLVFGVDYLKHAFSVDEVNKFTNGRFPVSLSAPFLHLEKAGGLPWMRGRIQKNKLVYELERVKDLTGGVVRLLKKISVSRGKKDFLSQGGMSSRLLGPFSWVLRRQ